MTIRSSLEEVVLFISMVTVECTTVGMNTVCKAAMSKGMNNFVLTVYSYALATLILIPPSFIFYRSDRPSLSFSVIWRIFLLGLIGSTSVICGYTGIDYSSPTLSSAMGNLVPAFTLILSVLIRMEKLDLRITSSQAKTLGTIVSISGAFVVTLYKGPSIILTSSTFESSSNSLYRSPHSQWILGGLLLAIQYLLFPFWYIVQATVVKDFPAELIIILIYNFFTTFQSATVSLIVERDPSAWRIRTGLDLAAIFSAAVFNNIVSTGIHTWVLHKKGPVYVAMFRPLGIVLAFVMGVIFLGDTVHLGSVIGATIIVIGFYAVIWGKSKEEEIVMGNGPSSLESSNQKDPLLARHKESS